MNAVSLKDGNINLEKLVEQVIADAEATIIVTKSGDQAVVVPLDEYNSWKETAYLLSNPANADHLRRSIDEARMEGSAAVRVLREEASDGCRGERLLERLRGRATSGLSTEEAMALTRQES